jgi:hypothetical protein
MGKAGLYRSDRDEPIPLRGVHVYADLIDYCGTITIEQMYKNEEKNSIEARYCVYSLSDYVTDISFHWMKALQFVGLRPTLTTRSLSV